MPTAWVIEAVDVLEDGRLSLSTCFPDCLPLALAHIMAALSRGSVPKSPLAWRVAVHETGHAVLAYILGIGEIQELSLKGDGGQILIFRAGWEGTVQAFDDQIAYCLAGRAAEILVLGDASGGSENSDLAIATSLALQLERTAGLGLNGLVWEPVGAAARAMSESERQSVSQRLDAQSARAHGLLEPHREALLKIAAALVDQGHLSGDEVGRMLPDNAQNTLQTSVAA